jgi:Leucine-rich repeat (LRR) protein
MHTQELFDADAGLPHLVKLVARNNLLQTLPRSLGMLGQLVLLDVSHNHLDVLPPLE